MPTKVSEEHLAFAALSGLGIRPDAPRLGWRLWGEARHSVGLVCGTDMYERQLILHSDGAITLTGGDRDLTLRDVRIETGHMRATTGPYNAQIEARAVHASRPDGLLISVQSGGVVHDFSMFDARLGSAMTADEGHVVVAPMTGMIVTLDISVGDTVEPGMKLGVMEAMKMETSLIAPRAGRIATVLCAAGQTVEGGAVLVTLEEEVAA